MHTTKTIPLYSRAATLWMAVLLINVMMFVAPAAEAEKPRLGVAEFRNTSGAYWWYGGIGWDLSSMLTNEIANNGNFRVVERAKLQPVLAEQDLAADGRIKQDTAAKTGELTGAKYLVLGTVSAYQDNTDNESGGFSFKGIRIGGKKKEAYIAVDLRVVDTTTGEIAFNRTVEARTGGFGLKFGLSRGSFSGNLGKMKKTPAGKAIRAVMVEIVDYLECSMVDGGGECEAEYAAKEEKRKKGLKNLLKLD